MQLVCIAGYCFNFSCLISSTSDSPLFRYTRRDYWWLTRADGRRLCSVASWVAVRPSSASIWTMVTSLRRSNCTTAAQTCARGSTQTVPMATRIAMTRHSTWRPGMRWSRCYGQWLDAYIHRYYLLNALFPAFIFMLLIHPISISTPAICNYPFVNQSHPGLFMQPAN